MTTTPKLIRDKVPENAAARGGHLITSVLSPDEFSVKVREKLIEEAQEVLAADTKHNLVGELADVSELIQAIALANGISLEEIEQHRLTKLSTNGGFAKRLLLLGKQENTQAV